MTIADSDASVWKYRIEVADDVLGDLVERLRRTRWSSQETVSDWSQGVPLEWLKGVCEYWRNDYDWRRVETEMNTLGSFVTDIDGLALHFLHVRSSHDGATPILLSHGWPGSIVEFLDVIPRLTQPERFGGAPEDAFHVVVPSLPGYGFSAKPLTPGFGVEKIADTFVTLMSRLGYRGYIAQGGDWGSEISLAVAEGNEDCVGAHVNFLATPPPATVRESPTESEKRAMDAATAFAYRESAYLQQQRTFPQTLGYGLTDSPAGQAAWILEKFFSWTDNCGDPRDAIRLDRLLDNVTLYWITESATSSARLYWESASQLGRRRSSARTAYSAFPREVVRPSQRWASARLSRIVYWGEVFEGGHFAAFEEPELFASEVRCAAHALGRSR